MSVCIERRQKWEQKDEGTGSIKINNKTENEMTEERLSGMIRKRKKRMLQTKH